MSIPEWMMVDLLLPNKTQNYAFFDDVMALIHCNEEQSALYNYAEIVSSKKVDISGALKFIKITCKTIEEARRRGVIVALLSYDLTRRNFIKLNTARMIEEHIFLTGLSKIWAAKGIK